jgi:hypothetical protein
LPLRKPGKQEEEDKQMGLDQEELTGSVIGAAIDAYNVAIMKFARCSDTAPLLVLSTDGIAAYQRSAGLVAVL